EPRLPGPPPAPRRGHLRDRGPRPPRRRAGPLLPRLPAAKVPGPRRGPGAGGAPRGVMGTGGLCVLADDLTGACDVGAALLPWPEPVLVDVVPGAVGRGGLRIRNTQSRGLAPADAAERVRCALAAEDRDGADIVLKKIDTGLRGPLGAEIDAAMDAVG